MNTLSENHGKQNHVEIPGCVGLDKPLKNWLFANFDCGVVISGYSFSTIPTYSVS